MRRIFSDVCMSQHPMGRGSTVPMMAAMTLTQVADQTPCRPVRIGTAGWSIPRQVSASFPGAGPHLEQYSQVLNCVEINSSFYRRHRFEVYEKWALQTPESFRFSVKVPQAITHDGPLRAERAPLLNFLADVAGLGPRLEVLLVQLPPSSVFEARRVRNFFALFTELFAVAVVCEPRHASWFAPDAQRLLAALGVSRVAADPARSPKGAHPAGWLGPDGDGSGAVLYHRWHGSPRIYWSRYDAAWLRGRHAEVQQWPDDAVRWCIFDNTASGAAIVNALEFQALQVQGRRP